MSFTTIADLEARLATRLDPAAGLASRPTRGFVDLSINGDRPILTPAAVLAPIVRRPEGWTMLLTQRTESMPTHAGQVAFPGGRVQPEDGGPLETALRETEEEIGLHRALIQPIGRLETYATGTSYEIVPIVGYVEPGFELSIDPREVHDTFETPLSFLFDPERHGTFEIDFQGGKRVVYEMTHNERRIWGVTAAIIRTLYERLYVDEPAA